MPSYYQIKRRRGSRVDVYLFVPIPSEVGRYFLVPTCVRDHTCPTCLSEPLEPCRTGAGWSKHRAKPHPERSLTGPGNHASRRGPKQKKPPGDDSSDG